MTVKVDEVDDRACTIGPDRILELTVQFTKKAEAKGLGLQL